MNSWKLNNHQKVRFPNIRLANVLDGDIPFDQAQNAPSKPFWPCSCTFRVLYPWDESLYPPLAPFVIKWCPVLLPTAYPLVACNDNSDNLVGMGIKSWSCMWWLCRHFRIITGAVHKPNNWSCSVWPHFLAQVIYAVKTGWIRSQQLLHDSGSLKTSLILQQVANQLPGVRRIVFSRMPLDWSWRAFKCLLRLVSSIWMYEQDREYGGLRNW